MNEPFVPQTVFRAALIADEAVRGARDRANFMTRWVAIREIKTKAWNEVRAGKK